MNENECIFIERERERKKYKDILQIVRHDYFQGDNNKRKLSLPDI